MAVVDPLSVSCGVCGAITREPCRYVSGRAMNKPHVVRVSAAKRRAKGVSAARRWAKGEGPPHSRPA